MIQNTAAPIGDQIFAFIKILTNTLMFREGLGSLISWFIILFFAWTIIKILNWRRSIEKDAIAILGFLKTKEVNWSTKIENHNELSKQFNSKSNEFRHPWREFTETLVQERGERQVIQSEAGDSIHFEHKIYNTQPANNFFNYGQLVETSKSIESWRSAPNILTGLGIMGTFLGILMALYMSSVDGNSLNEGAFVEQIKTAFVTSIFGLFFSLLFTWSKMQIADKLSSDFSEIADSIDRLYTRRTSENYLHTLTEKNELIATNIALLASELPEKIAKALAGGQVMESINSAVTENMEAGFRQLSETLNSTVEQHEAINEQSATMVAQLEKVQEGISSYLEASSSLSEKLRATAESFDLASKGVTASTAEFSNVNTRLQESAVQVQEAYAAQSNTIEEIRSKTQLVADSIRASSGSAIEANEKIKESLVSSLTAFDSGLATGVDKLNSSSGKIGETIAALSGYAETISKEIAKIPQLQASIRDLNRDE